MQTLPENKKIVLFDGVCNLCNSTVQFIIKHDRKDIFRFVALQSTIGQKICKHIGLDQNIDSIVLYQPTVAYFYKSSAVFEIAKALGGIYSFVLIFSIIPKNLSDLLYDFIAKNRYKWYGKKQSCMIPTPEIRTKFLS
jgi:predicted DCC family thiol-disulfide oxidoreductase YuxK